MAFEKGKSGNPSGRPLGSKNKVQAEVKQFIESLITENIETLRADFKSLKPYAKVRLMTEILPYIIPRLSSNSNEFEKLSDDQLDEIINRLKNASNE